MNGLYTVARIYAGIMGFIILGGILWFASALSGAIVVAGMTAGASSLIASLIPPRKFSDGAIRRTLIGLCAIGIGAGLVLVVDDLSAPRAIEWDVVSMKTLDIASLAAMATIALKWRPASEQ